MLEHSFVLFELLFLASLLLKLPGGILWAEVFVELALTYLLIDVFLQVRFNIRLRPSLFAYLRHPASFWSSLRQTQGMPFLFSLIAALCFAGWGVFYFQEKIQDFSLLFGLLAGGIWIRLRSTGINALFLVQKELLKREKKQKNLSSISLHVPQGPKQFDIRIDPQEKPHIIFLFLESFRAKNVGCLGAKEPLSPHFDRLAEQGVLFTQFHTTSNRTCRSTLSSLCGVLPAEKNWGLERYKQLPNLPSILNQRGWHPAFIQGGYIPFDGLKEFLKSLGVKTLIGKKEILQEMGPSPITSWGVYDETLMKFAASWLAKQTEPSFLNLYTITNHHPWIGPDSWPKSKIPFYDTFSYTDWALGLFIEELRTKKLLEKTILVISGDHGQSLEDRDPYYEINRNLYQETIHVPLLFYAEGRTKPLRINELSSQIDLFPTLLDLLQIPQASQGRSLLRASSTPIFFNSSFLVDRPIRGCRKDQWKLLLGRSEELYNLASDPEEKHNLANQEDVKLKELKKLIEKNSSSLESFYGSEHIQIELDLSHSLRVTDEILKQTIYPELSSLTLTNSILVTDEGISSFLANHPSLKTLNIGELDEITGAFWPSHPNLEKLFAIGCPNLQKPFFDWMKNLSSLRFLELGADHLTDEDLSSPPSMLTMLRLAYMSKITDRSVMAWVRSNSLDFLQIEHCPEITDNSLLSLQNRPLQLLYLVNCPKISLTGIHSLPLSTAVCVRDCPQLEAQFTDLTFLKRT